MYHSEWRTNKTIYFVNSVIQAKFETLWEDQRDSMSDCVRPDMGISHSSRNRRVSITEGRNVFFCREVTSEEGNLMYKDILEISKMWNPFKQHVAMEEWARTDGSFAEGRLEWVIQGQKH